MNPMNPEPKSAAENKAPAAAAGATLKYLPTIGLEIHAELKTTTKMFCGCLNNPDEEHPNYNVCPICMGHPGTLPVINKQAVKHVLKMGTAVGGTLADFTEFDRKNYFYPDIPKGYQISQYKFPLVTGGSLAGVELTRVHLEEDTATSKHDQGDFSQVDFNRAGVPLMELVTEPVIHSAEQAADFAKELQTLLRYLGAGDANMEKGEMRVEANISVALADENPAKGLDVPAKKFGTKVEVKNLNSFRAAERAITYEIARHIDLLERGEKIIQETRGWDENSQKTFSQRVKEDSHDYRYFPDPDLPKLKLSEAPEFSKENLKKELPELPWEKRARLKNDFGLKDDDADMFVKNEMYGKFFDLVVKNVDLNKNKEVTKKAITLAANYIASDVAGFIKNTDIKNIPVSNEAFAKLMLMLAEGKLSSRAGKDILKIMFEKGGDPEAIVNEHGLMQKNDEGELKTIIEKILAEYPNVVADYKNGKESALMFFVGQGMKATKGSANPELLKKITIEAIH
ncbi:MAG: Asp-tRNA(Asn)/Glu-tRNA(Gln) amidotransferase subunit GatB [Candidatus Pacebacteria bacterium]|nr:Asp-tRNA(Asn)/Glu-tRNA(Gln) amidotransferase subunit GatB [Candidatus Paceibacterota bacterium]